MAAAAGGWENSNYAGGAAGEAVVTSFTAGIQRWYADIDLGGTLDFSQDWQATGLMDFFANSASDGGMFFGFFNRDTSLQANTETMAGFLLVNDQLSCVSSVGPIRPTLRLPISGSGRTGIDHSF
jgi:hypothetical protein